MELRHLRYFIALAEELNFTAAAQRLRISQPPLSQQIRDLEQELGAMLFVRTSRKVLLTEAGTAFLAHARSITASAELASAQVRAIGEGRTGAFNVATTGSVLLGPLARLMAEYQRRVPGVLVGLNEMAPEAQLIALHTRAADISFMRLPPVDAELVCQTAWREQVGVLLPAGHRLAKCAAIALTDLRDDKHVFLRLRDSGFAQYLRDCCVDAGFMPRISQEVVEALFADQPSGSRLWRGPGPAQYQQAVAAGDRISRSDRASSVGRRHYGASSQSRSGADAVSRHRPPLSGGMAGAAVALGRSSALFEKAISRQEAPAAIQRTVTSLGSPSLAWTVW